MLVASRPCLHNFNVVDLSDGGSHDAMYDVNLLDDPEMTSGKHRTSMAFKSYMVRTVFS